MPRKKKVSAKVTPEQESQAKQEALNKIATFKTMIINSTITKINQIVTEISNMPVSREDLADIQAHFKTATLHFKEAVMVAPISMGAPEPTAQKKPKKKSKAKAKAKAKDSSKTKLKRVA
jgi:hypothetical protein